MSDLAKEYEKLSLGWETDRIVAARRSKWVAWTVAGVAVAAACVACLAVAVLTPLKEKVPYVIRVDNTTGRVDVASALQGGPATYDEAINKYFAVRYVRAREGFSRALAETNYETVGLMSTGSVAQRFHEAFKPDNPASPLKRYAGQSDGVEVRIINVSFLTPTVASIRYERTERVAQHTSTSLWTATVTFQYAQSSMRESDRLVNPLGFQVTDYRVDPEVVKG